MDVNSYITLVIYLHTLAYDDKRILRQVILDVHPKTFRLNTYK